MLIDLHLLSASARRDPSSARHPLFQKRRKGWKARMTGVTSRICATWARQKWRERERERKLNMPRWWNKCMRENVNSRQIDSCVCAGTCTHGWGRTITSSFSSSLLQRSALARISAVFYSLAASREDSINMPLTTRARCYRTVRELRNSFHRWVSLATNKNRLDPIEKNNNIDEISFRNGFDARVFISQHSEWKDAFIEWDTERGKRARLM